MYANLTNKIKDGAVGIMPTDTIYGLVGSALSPAVVEKIYEMKQRPADMPFIVLISDWNDLNKLGVEITPADREILEKNWPDSVSFILPCPDKKFTYLHRGKNTLAVRWPNNENLNDLISNTGPIIATSVNLSGQLVITTINEARDCFSGKVNFYVDGGTIMGSPSTLAKIENGKIEILRQGEYVVKNDD